MHPLFAQLLQRHAARPARHESLPGHVMRMTLPPSREMSIRRPGAATRAVSGQTLFTNRPATASPIDILLEDLQTLAPRPAVETQAPTTPTRPAEQPDGVHLRIDPQDHQRVRISGSMREVCAALDALIAVQ